MASHGKKKVIVGKDDLRRLMKETKNSSASKGKKIDSPLARYNNLGQLSCMLCNCPVKSELLWNAHIQGRTHKETVARLKEEKQKRNEAFVKPPPPATSKRKALDTGIGSHVKSLRGADHSLKTKSALPSDFLDSTNGCRRDTLGKSKPSLSATAAATIGLGSYESSSSEDEDSRDVGSRKPAACPGAPAATADSSLPTDFFDPGIAPSTAAVASTPKQPEAVMSEKLPEGFFDDPKQDAKVRRVEYRDKLEEEWERFKKTMKEEHQVSEVIMDEEDEAVNTERKITEIDEQLHQWSKINELAKQKEKLMAAEVKQELQDSEEDDVDDGEYENFLEWRSKKV